MKSKSRSRGGGMKLTLGNLTVSWIFLDEFEILRWRYIMQRLWIAWQWVNPSCRPRPQWGFRQPHSPPMNSFQGRSPEARHLSPLWNTSIPASVVVPSPFRAGPSSSLQSRVTMSPGKEKTEGTALISSAILGYHQIDGVYEICR